MVRHENVTIPNHKMAETEKLWYFWLQTHLHENYTVRN
jgi:hypothetical protein